MYPPSHYNKININILDPVSEYPEQIFKHCDALYYPSKDIVFIATKPSSDHYENVYTELAIWEPEEIRLIGTKTLSVLLPLAFLFFRNTKDSRYTNYFRPVV